MKLAHACDALPVLQSGTTEAQDLDYNSRYLEMDYSILRWSDRPFIIYGTSGPKARDGLALAETPACGWSGACVKAGRKVDHLRRLKSDPPLPFGVGGGERPASRRPSP